MQNIHWNHVYEKEAGALLGVAYRYVKDRKQAEDIVQNAFLTAIQKVETFRGTGAFEAWLRRIVVNEALMFLRVKSPVFSGLNEQIEGISDENISVDDTSAFHVIQQAEFSQHDLLETANLLPEHHRVVFQLYVIDRYSHKEIAQQLSISEGTSKSHLNRARKKLQGLLYQKAIAMKKHRKKSLFLLAWFSALWGKANPVDTLYREAFMHFTLPAPTLPLGIEMASSTVSIGLSSGAITGIATAIGGSALVLGTLTYQAFTPPAQTSTSVPMQSNEVPARTWTFAPAGTWTLAPAGEIPNVIEVQTPQEPVFTAISEDTALTVKPVQTSEKKLETPQITEEKPEEEETAPPVFIKKITVIDSTYED